MATIGPWRRRGAVSDLKALGLESERSRAQSGGVLAHSGRRLERPSCAGVRWPGRSTARRGWRLGPSTDDRPCPQFDGVPVDSVARPCGSTSPRNEASTLKPAVANRKRARSIYPVFQSTRGAFCSRDLMPRQGAGGGWSKFPRTPAYRQCAGARARRSHRLGSLRFSRRTPPAARETAPSATRRQLIRAGQA